MTGRGVAVLLLVLLGTAVLQAEEVSASGGEDGGVQLAQRRVFLDSSKVKARFFQALLWPLKRVWRLFVMRTIVPTMLGAKVVILWPTLLILVGLLESALAGMLFFYLFFTSAVALPSAVPRVDRVLLAPTPATLYWWHQEPTAEPYRTILPEDVTLGDGEAVTEPPGVRRAADNPQVTYYSAYAERRPPFQNPGA